MQQKNFFLAVVLSALIVIGWVSLSRYLWPPPERKQPSPSEVAEKEPPRKDVNAFVTLVLQNQPLAAVGCSSYFLMPPVHEGDKLRADDSKKGGLKEKPDKAAAEKKPKSTEIADLQQLRPTPANRLVALGSKARDSRFHLFVQFDPRGGGVHGLWCNKYQAADALGRPVWDNAEKTEPAPLELIPPDDYRHSPSFQLFAYDVHAPNDDQPLDTLGRRNWTVLDHQTAEVEGRRRESVSFQAETQGAIVTKTYTLTEGEYHLGLSVKMRRKDESDKKIAFRYQMTGAHGLPVEGNWYTSIFRNALIARVDKNGTVTRDLQDLRQIGLWDGGNVVLPDGENALLYAAVVNQYFASAIVVDNEQKHRGFLRQARPTLETALTKGAIVGSAEDGSSFVLQTEKGTEQTFYLPKGERLRLPKGARLAVLHHTGSCNERNGDYPEIAIDHFPEDAKPALWVDDITVRVSTEAVELKSGEEVEHKYLLYHGPVKLSQLFPPPGLSSKPLEKGGVQSNLFERYHDELHLNTLTDYHTPGPMGRFANAIYFTALVVKCTNVMHAILGYIHAVIPSYGLCIIVLTVLVRGMMFPLSRKQALMSVRMQQLQPELKKLQEKYKDDRQALGLAQMELYRKHGVNPLGSCWVILLQMPIFMGLYFALQESTHFRLAEFWPLWITNLAAPDMLISWSDKIPFLSRVQDYGSFLYLGPYFNLLPVIAVVLMIGQQKMMTPPPADEQQAMQQKMMKYMMIFFGLMFYKVAAGLCLYFIASSVWGFCERKLLPKKKADDVAQTTPPNGDGYFQKLLRQARGEQVTPAPVTGVATLNGGTFSTETRGRSSGKRGRNKRRQGPSSTADAEEADNVSVFGRWRKRLRDWWMAVLKEAEKKNRG